MSGIKRASDKSDTPIVIFIWQRPDMTRRVFDAVRQMRPKILVVIADGPNLESSSRDNCKAAQDVVQEVDWPCDVYRNYSAYNLGLKKRIESGLDFVFSLFDKALIFEDDCVADPSFFRFAEDMLEYYKYDENICCISGDKPLGISIADYSYGFSNYPLIWGWATWRRVWQEHDRHLKSWPTLRNEDFLYRKIGSYQATKYWTDIFDKQYEGSTNSWAYAFMYNCFTKSMRTIIPSVNLVSNIGFGEQATHTTSASSHRANNRAASISYPLIHPTSDVAEINNQLEKNIFSGDADAYRFSVGGYNDKWKAYSPSVTSTAGNLGEYEVSAIYKIEKNVVYVSITLKIIDNNTASDGIVVILPIIPEMNATLTGDERGISGLLIKGTIIGGNYECLIRNYDNSYVGGSGSVMVLSGSYHVL